MTRYCSSCRRQRPLREFDLGGGQLSTTCLRCSNEQMRTEDQRARDRRVEQIAELDRRRREQLSALMQVDTELLDLRAQPALPPGGMSRFCAGCRFPRPLSDFDLGSDKRSKRCLACVREQQLPPNQRARALRAARIGELEPCRRELIAALVKLDAELADLRGRPMNALGTFCMFEECEDVVGVSGVTADAVSVDDDFVDADLGELAPEGALDEMS